jgi:hypothetical protein
MIHFESSMSFLQVKTFMTMKEQIAHTLLELMVLADKPNSLIIIVG